MKPKVAFYWCGSCGGCEEAVVDLAENILKVVGSVDIIFWPVAMDFKKEDVEKLEDEEILASFINGTIRLSEHLEMAELLRKKSKLLIAFGACAHLGGVPGLSQMFTKEEILKTVYETSPSVENPRGVKPIPHTKIELGELDVPEFLDKAFSLDQVVDVDYYIPGCPPTPKVILNALQVLLSGELPPKGTVFGSKNSLCAECPLNETKPEKIYVKEFKRPHEVEIDPEKCLLIQGLICLGPVTRGGCEALCVKGNMPCTGCFGPLDGVIDMGAKALSYIASIIDSNDPAEIEKIIEKIPDPVGTFYRYSLPYSLLLGGKRNARKES